MTDVTAKMVIYDPAHLFGKSEGLPDEIIWLFVTLTWTRHAPYFILAGIQTMLIYSAIWLAQRRDLNGAQTSTRLVKKRKTPSR